MITRTVIPIGAGTPMDSSALYRLMAWLSPGYPIGSFTYSHGIEWAVEDGAITDADSLHSWLGDLLQFGGGWSDAVLFRHAWQAAADNDEEGFREVSELALVLGPTAERRLETIQQGNAFMLATRASWPWTAAPEQTQGGDTAYPVAVASAVAGHGVPLAEALNAYLHAFAANLISAGVRLIPLGQTDGQRVLARLESTVIQTSADAMVAALAQVGGAAFLSDIASMRHETQYTRLFRS
jgi:urease accessory protein